MDRLSPRQRKLLRELPKHQRIAQWVGIALTLCGVAYVVWAIDRFHPRADPSEKIGFDAPIVSEVANHYTPFKHRLEERIYDDGRERAMAISLIRGMNYAGGLHLLAFRVILGLLAAMLGLAHLTVVVERRRLLRMIEALDDTPPADAPAN